MMVAPPPTILATPASPLSPSLPLAESHPHNSADRLAASNTETINPLYALSERVISGDVEEVHLVSAREGDAVLTSRGGGLLRGETWTQSEGARVDGEPVVAGAGGDGKKGKGGEGVGGRDESVGAKTRGKSAERERRGSPSIHSALERAASRDSIITTSESGRPTSHYSLQGPSSDAGTSDGGHSRRGREQGSSLGLGMNGTGSNKSLAAAVNGSSTSSYPPLSSSAPQGGSIKRSSILGGPVQGSPLLASTSNPSPSRTNRNSIARTGSYGHRPTTPYDPLQPDGTTNVDEVESSIQAQEEVIRRERQTKRLERAKEREREEGDAGGSLPMLKRRSTRAGSTSETGPGAGVLVGNLIGQDHANYVLMYNMLTGIRIAVSRCQAKPLRPLTDEDYSAKHKFSFDIVGNELTPSTKYDFKFKDYAPWVFRELREYFCLDPSDYLVSLTAKYILSELGSPGKSGSFFYFSRDYRFIIKTIRHSEHKFLRKILKEYHEYIKKNPHTLLSRFYGLHRVKLPRGRKIHFVIMNNLFPPHRDIHETYDLKGSAIGRIYPEEKAVDNPAAILKDLNWVTRNRQLSLGPEKKALFEEQLRRDTELMQKLHIMDYSLLTGIHNIGRGNVDNLRDGLLTVFQPDTVKVRRKPTQLKRDADASAVRQAVQRSDPKALSHKNALPEQDTSERRMFIFYQDEGGFRATGDENEDVGVIYYLGIIDILTPYTCIKVLENFFRGLKHDRHMISAVPPVEYGDRFMAFIYSIIRGNDESKRPRMFETPKGETSQARVEGKGKKE